MGGSVRRVPVSPVAIHGNACDQGGGRGYVIDATFILYPLEVVTNSDSLLRCTGPVQWAEHLYVRDCVHAEAKSPLCGATCDCHRETCLCVEYIVS